MKYRKLRIAWSVGWGIVAVLLVVLWVRSYCRSTLSSNLSTNRLYGWGIETTVSNFPGSIEYLSDTIISGTILSTGWQLTDYSEPIGRMKTDHPVRFGFLWKKDHSR